MTLSDALPSGVAFVSATSAAGSCSGPPVLVPSCSLGSIEPGAEAVATVVFHIASAGSYTNSATVSATTDDPDSANNTASSTVAVPRPRPPPPPPPPGPNELFSFGPEMSTTDQTEIKGYEAYAFQDEAALVGAPITSVAAFASTNPDWLGEQECRFWGDGSDSCIQFYSDRFASGSSAAQGGPGGVFLYWAAPGFGNGPASEKQKIIAHELFHVLQYQLHRLLNNGATPSSQVRPSGPVWFDEGSAEMVGYRVASDRGLFPSYATVLESQIQSAKKIGVPLSSLETLDQANGIVGAYSLFHVAVDHLVSITPSGMPALATYLKALGAGMAWRDAFKLAFGMTVETYYANFAAYRAGL